MFEIVTILGLIYLLYRIRFFYKEGNYNQVKSFVSILTFITTVLVLKQFYDYKYITFEVYYNISLLNCNMKLNSIQIYNFINFFKKDIQGSSII